MSEILLLGAGASVEAGVPDTYAMTRGISAFALTLRRDKQGAPRGGTRPTLGSGFAEASASALKLRRDESAFAKASA